MGKVPYIQASYCFKKKKRLIVHIVESCFLCVISVWYNGITGIWPNLFVSLKQAVASVWWEGDMTSEWEFDTSDIVFGWGKHYARTWKVLNLLVNQVADFSDVSGKCILRNNFFSGFFMVRNLFCYIQKKKQKSGNICCLKEMWICFCRWSKNMKAWRLIKRDVEVQERIETVFVLQYWRRLWLYAILPCVHLSPKKKKKNPCIRDINWFVVFF